MSQYRRDQHPIVFAVAFDPVGSGFAASLARPGGNITGLSVIDVDPSPKRLELLKTMLPALSRVAVLSAGAERPKKHRDADAKDKKTQALQ